MFNCSYTCERNLPLWTLLVFVFLRKVSMGWCWKNCSLVLCCFLGPPTWCKLVAFVRMLVQYWSVHGNYTFSNLSPSANFIPEVYPDGPLSVEPCRWKCLGDELCSISFTHSVTAINAVGKRCRTNFQACNITINTVCLTPLMLELFFLLHIIYV